MNSKDKKLFELTEKMVHLHVLVATAKTIWAPLQQGICRSVITLMRRKIIMELGYVLCITWQNFSKKSQI